MQPVDHERRSFAALVETRRRDVRHGVTLDLAGGTALPIALENGRQPTVGLAAPTWPAGVLRRSDPRSLRVRADPFRLPFPDAAFTLVVTPFPFPSAGGADCPSRTDLLKEVARVTALAGWLALDAFASSVCVPTLDDLGLMLADSGFRIKDVCGDDEGAAPGPESRRIMVLARRVMVRGC